MTPKFDLDAGVLAAIVVAVLAFIVAVVAII